MGKKASGAGEQDAEDRRFDKFKKDPKFRRAPQEVTKFKADARFQQMFTNQEFQGPAPAKVDARGKKVKQVKNNLAKLYDLKEQDCIDDEGNFRWDVESSSEDEALVPQDQEVDDALAWEEEEDIPTGDATKQIAVMKCDWKAINSIDLLALFRSFCPETGSVERVTIYPSEFGKQQEEKERLKGPSSDVIEGEEGAENYKVRKYEMDLLKYYYAVVECDTVETAEVLFKECEGLEIERTSNVLDLRFIPDSLQEFPYPPKEVAETVPQDYTIKDFFTRALQHSKVKCTWDEVPIERTLKLNKAFQEEDMDLSAYLAPMSSDEEIHLEAEDKGNQSQFNKMKESNVDLEVTFNTAFDDIASNLKHKDETVWEKQERKQKQSRRSKMKERMERKQESKVAKKATLDLLVEDTDNQHHMDSEDSRFGAVYDQTEYSLDPTNPRFKRDAEGNQQILKAQMAKKKAKTTE